MTNLAISNSVKHVSHNAVGPPTNQCKAILDTGSTGHYFAVEAPLLHKQPTKSPIDVHLPDHTTMSSTMTALLPIPQLPLPAREVHIFPALGNTSLMSIGQLCDAGCQANFNATTAEVYFQQKLILTGHRNSETSGLWTMSIPTRNQANTTINMNAKPEDLVQFAHRSLWSPANSTLLKALQRGHLPPFPGLSVKTLRKFPPRSEATIKDHLDSARKNAKSTKEEQKAAVDPLLKELLDDAFPPQNTSGERTHQVFVALHELKSMLHTDLTGRLPVPSNSGNQYILFAYNYDSNCILLQPVRNRKAPTLLEGYKHIVKRLVKGGCKPKLQRLDNEASELLKEYMHEQKIDFQLVPQIGRAHV